MNIIQTSFSAVALIIVVVIIRALALHKLPKKTFLVLWGVVVVRLLLPEPIPSQFSFYTALNTVKQMLAEWSAPPHPENMGDISYADTIPAAVQPIFINASTVPLSSVTIVWLSGFCLCAMFFIATYLKAIREFQTSLPVDNDFVVRWIHEHSIRRSVQIRQSDKITAPLTYGLFRPQILLPKTMDWTNEARLRFILTHELVHIRRFDALTKWLLAFVFCLNWFNPFVWVMYVLANRDLELSCDETVLKIHGESFKSAYAMTLIDMEEHKTKLSLLNSHFSKNAIEERIVSIMKIRKFSLTACILAAAVILGSATVFATSAAQSSEHVSGQNAASDKAGKGPDLWSDDDSLAVERVASGKYSNSYNKIPAGDAQTFGGYALHEGDQVALNYSNTGGKLEVRILEYTDRTPLDGKLVDNGSEMTITKDGNYYFLIQNLSQNETPSENVKIEIKIN